jgi:RNA polymerase sigma-70 factor (ECF subfamily)
VTTGALARSSAVTSIAATSPFFADSSPMRPFLPGFLRPRTAQATPGFEAAVSALYRERFPSLYRYLDRTLDDDQLAADIAQEAFVRLFDRGSLPEEPAAWLIAVAHNLVRDHFRRAGRRLRLLDAAGRDEVRPAAPLDPAASVERDERRSQVRAVLDRLKPRERDVLLLSHSDYSHREIAVALDLSETNVSTILQRAGAAFRRVYQELHGDAT